MAIARRMLEFAVVGRQKTWRFKVKQDGSALNLTSLTVLAKLVKPDGTTQYDGTVSKPTQTGDDLGRFTVTSAAGDTNTAGTHKLDVYIGASSTEEPPDEMFQFEAYASETE